MEPELPKNPTREQLDRWARQVSYGGNPTPPSLRNRERRPSSAMRAGLIVFALRHFRPW